MSRFVVYYLVLRKKPMLNRYLMKGSVAILIILMTGFSFLLSAQEGNYSADQISEDIAIELALQRPNLTQKWKAQALGATAQSKVARAWSNPLFDFSREHIRDNSSQEAENSIVIEQPLPLSNRRRLFITQADFDVQSVEIETLLERSEVIIAVQNAFYSLLHNQMKIDAYSLAVEGIEDAIIKVEKQVDKGETSLYELERLRREKAEIQTQRSIAIAELEMHRNVLAGWIFDTPETQGSNTVEATGQLLPTTIPDESFVERAIAGHPAIQAVERQVSNLKTQEKLAAQWWIPDISLRGGLKQQSHIAERSWGYIAGISMTIPLLNQQQGERQHIQARLMETIHRNELRRQNLLAIARGTAQQVRRLHAAAMNYKEEVLLRAERIVTLAAQSYHAGEASILELIDAHQGLLSARLQELELAWQCRQKYVELQMGLLTEQYSENISAFTTGERE